MKKIIVALMFSFFTFTGLFAVDYATAKKASENFIADKNAGILKITIQGMDACFLISASKIWSIEIIDDRMSFVGAEDIFDNIPNLPLDKILSISYDKGVFSIVTDKSIYRK